MSPNSATEPEKTDEQPQHFVLQADPVVYEGLFGPDPMKQETDSGCGQ